MSDKKNGLTYADAGVDIDAGNALVDRIKPAAAATNRSGVMAGLGGFGALFDLKAAGFSDPILVGATDGVGTKLRIAIDTGHLDTIGIDLVAMCVNDLVCQGAEPLFFLDYFATGKLEMEAAATIIEGIAEGCKRSGCALIGGETAEMPGMYGAGDFDLAGFAVGAMERGAGLPAEVQAGDVLLGLASDGVHSNGYSLVRRVVERSGLAWDAASPFGDGSLGQALLTPTRLYVIQCLTAIRSGGVNALAHITGGGLTENIPRVLPDDLGVSIDLDAWELLRHRHGFGRLQRQGRAADAAAIRDRRNGYPTGPRHTGAGRRLSWRIALKRVAILISGGGSNMLKLVESMDEDHPATPCLVMANNLKAKGLDRAAALGVPIASVDHRPYGAEARPLKHWPKRCSSSSIKSTPRPYAGSPQGTANGATGQMTRRDKSPFQFPV